MICPSCKADNDAGAESCFTCGRMLAAVVHRGSLIASRYEVQTPLGKGGMGRVYKVRDRLLGETRAVKVLRADLSSSPEMARRFREEMPRAQKIRHPNVCRIHASGEWDGRLYLVMDCVDGQDLRQAMRPGQPMAPELAFAIGLQLADGLQAVHDAGLVHRDVKPANVMLDARGAARLMDFDIAKQWQAENTAKTSTGQPLGTPEYMSPEYARGGGVDFRSDLYSLGVVLFEMFAGRPPFHADTHVATILKHLHEPPPLDGPLAGPIPSALRPLLFKALAKRPDDRYTTTSGLGAALRLAHTTFGIQARAAPRQQPAAPDPLPALLGALNPRDATVRIQLPVPPPRPDAAANAAIPVLLQALGGSEASPLPPALSSSATLPGVPTPLRPGKQDAVAILIHALRSKDERDRTTAARALGSIGPAAREAIPVLIEALRDRNQDVRSGAAHALERIGPEAADALREALNDRDAVVRQIAQDALQRILRYKRGRDAT
jgi:serine/threonine-protein kinase